MAAYGAGDLSSLADGMQNSGFCARLDRSSLQVADMLLYAPETSRQDPFGALSGVGIAEATRRYKSHVEVVCGITNGQVMVLAARWPKIGIYPVRIDDRLACVRRMPGAEHFDKERADLCVGPYLGQGYDWPGLLEFLLQPFIMPHAPVGVCSTLTARYLRAGGLEPFNPFVVTDSVTPGDFFVTGVPYTIWRNAPIDRAKYPTK